MSIDDEKWDSLLDQLTIDELKELTRQWYFPCCCHKRLLIFHISYETDGPTAVNSFFTGKFGTAFPAPIMVASTGAKSSLADSEHVLEMNYVTFGFTG